MESNNRLQAAEHIGLGTGMGCMVGTILETAYHSGGSLIGICVSAGALLGAMYAARIASS